MSDAPSDAAPVALGAIMVGGRLAWVAASLHPDFFVGKLVIRIAAD